MIKDDYHSATDLLKQIIAIPSLSGEEKLLSDFLSDWMIRQGWLAKRVQNNIIVESFLDDDLPTICLNSHMDTVKPVSGWTRDPYLPEETEDHIYGLGCSDAGGSVVSLIMAFKKLHELNQRGYNLILLISAEEETSGKNGIEAALAEIERIDLAIVGEPTDLKMAICERGLVVADCLAKGEAGHAAHQSGVNAILKAIKDIERIYQIEFEKKSDLLGNVQVEVTQIEGGYQHNVVPDSCTFVIDIRTNEHYTNEEVIDIIQSRLESEVHPRSYRLRSSFIDPEHPLVKIAEKMNIGRFGSRTMSDQALIPAPSVKLGPGKSERSHKADEFIEKIQIKQAIDLYYNLLKNIKIS